MAFSFRRMLSNINYFKKSGDENVSDVAGLGDHEKTFETSHGSQNIDFGRAEPDSTSKHCATSLKLPDSVKNFAAKKGSLSDTDALPINIDAPNKREKRKSKKLKIDIQKCSPTMGDIDSSSNNVENTPKHVLLDNKSTDLFSQHFKGIDMNHSFDIFDAMSNSSSICEEDEFDIESLSDRSETDISLESIHKEEVKMCRKVEPFSEIPDNQLVPSTTPESFGDVEVERNEEERVTLLLNYQMKLEKLDCILRKLLSEFKFHIEVSKVFHCRSVVTPLRGTDVKNIPNTLGEVTFIDNVSRGVSPTGSWNIIMEKGDDDIKIKLRDQLLSMMRYIGDFTEIYLRNQNEKFTKCKKLTNHNRKSITFDLYKGKRQKRFRISNKKKYKHFDFPDLRDAFINLFDPDSDDFNASPNNVTNISDYDDADNCKCACTCGHHRSPSSQTDSGLTNKNDRSMSSQSITSSIGNFSLDTSTLTAYSESLDLIVSYNSFQDTSLYSTLLQKAAIERITFYVQVHSIQLKCETSELEFESKNVITFSCPACKSIENEENGLLKHILSQSHCEKIHFLYKTAYIKKCVSAGKEIMPSTVLNPMKMYRDDNKIVCFGDAMYACSLCFENLIVGESILMAHCAEPEHIERRQMLCEMLD
ncbi:unnamed protein product [Chilo suppressalis]|uniref:C2H2-type domain-containing protein n=1 Tax=Chilo suppressalis TaxID=168631 RepID=A0ABN8B8B3_CHISP|nr:unnamed protein product [Chilo suppressalis]